MMLICSNVLKDIGLSVLFVTVAEEEKPFSKYMCNCLSPYHYTWLKLFKFITKEKKIMASHFKIADYLQNK